MEPSPIAPLRKSAYNASKAAVNVFTIHLAAEPKDTDIKVNSVHPRWIKTALGSDAAPMSVPDGTKITVAVDSSGIVVAGEVDIPGEEAEHRRRQRKLRR